MRTAGWTREPELDLPTLARRLGTNTGYLSRALNEGLGVNFSTFVNGIRCETVITALDAGEEGNMLELALDAGFASKASFNRAFRVATGGTPSVYRARVAKPEKVNASSNMRRPATIHPSEGMNRRHLLTGLAALPLLSRPTWASTDTNRSTGRDDVAVLRAAMAIHPGLYGYFSPRQVEANLALFERDYLAGAAVESHERCFLALSRFLMTIRCGHSYPSVR